MLYEVSCIAVISRYLKILGCDNTEVPNFNAKKKAGKRYKTFRSSSFNTESGDASINLNFDVGDDEEDEVQKLAQPMGRDKAKGLKKKGAGSSRSSSSTNDKTLASLMVSKLGMYNKRAMERRTLSVFGDRNKGGENSQMEEIGDFTSQIRPRFKCQQPHRAYMLYQNIFVVSEHDAAKSLLLTMENKGYPTVHLYLSVLKGMVLANKPEYMWSLYFEMGYKRNITANEKFFSDLVYGLISISKFDDVDSMLEEADNLSQQVACMWYTSGKVFLYVLYQALEYLLNS
ncbi:zinc finger BED domain-containing protein RICESLEEPER 2-like protein [Tanacetum coccineum]